MEWIIETLHKGEGRGSLGDSIDRSAPERPTVGENVHLIEKLTAIPQRLALIIHVFRLPLVDLVAPVSGILQAVFCDLPSVGSCRAIEIGVLLVPLAPGPELDDGHIPGNRHRHDTLLARFESKADGDSASQRFAAADPGLIVVSKPAVFRERLPHLISAER